MREPEPIPTLRYIIAVKDREIERLKRIVGDDSEMLEMERRLGVVEADNARLREALREARGVE